MALRRFVSVTDILVRPLGCPPIFLVSAKESYDLEVSVVSVISLGVVGLLSENTVDKSITPAGLPFDDAPDSGLELRRPRIWLSFPFFNCFFHSFHLVHDSVTI